MKSQKFSFIVVFIVTILLNSCSDSSKMDINTIDYFNWKDLNDQYFSNMKDSTGFSFNQDTVSNTKTGYYYKIVRQGDINSTSPSIEDSVIVYYRACLVNGLLINQNYSGTDPLMDKNANKNRFLLEDLIPGWQVNLPLMKIGEYRKIVLPYQLAYGKIQFGQILPYSTIIFDIHLVGIVRNKKVQE